MSSVSLSGANASEFTFINNCTAPVAPASNCTISLVFNPIGQGQRAAILTITDDAPSSPQTVSLIASANPAFTAGAAPNGSTTASVSAGQTAQYLLQLTPGAGYSGTVSLAWSGVPSSGNCLDRERCPCILHGDRINEWWRHVAALDSATLRSSVWNSHAASARARSGLDERGQEMLDVR